MLDTLVQPIRSHIVRQVRAAVSGAADGSAVIAPSDDAYFAPGSVIRRVHGDVTSMMVGGISALLLQMLHPSVLAGVWDHSNFRRDMAGRLHRTARFIAVTTYAARDDADRAIARVRSIHDRVSGTLPNGTPYRAADPHLLAWVHVAEAISFLDGWRRYGTTRLSAADEDDYFNQFGKIAELIGAEPIPRSPAQAEALVASFRPELSVDHRTREVAALIIRPTRLKAMPTHLLLTQAAIDLLPPWAREMQGLPAPFIARPLVRVGTAGIARTLRWAFG